jgi:hypothetical protein
VSRYFIHFISCVALLALTLGLSGCAYTFGYQQRNLPGGYTEVAVPVFKNQTQQVAIESYFSNALIRQFNRSKVAKIAPTTTAPVIIEGTIRSLKYLPGGQIDANRTDENSQVQLPVNTVLTVEYRVLMQTMVVLKRASDGKVLWSGGFENERVYTAPQVGLGTINSVNALYNHSARLEVIEQMAYDMMADAHDRMTENF